MITWIIGRGGLLGRAVSRSTPTQFEGSPVPWADADATVATLQADLTRFIDQAGRDGWSLIWTAGSGVVASSPASLATELMVFDQFFSAFRQRHPAGRGTVFLASSAGGVYAGSSDPPFVETTTPVPLSAYGETKLAQERLAAERLAGHVPLLIGRLTNLYGSDQNVDKPQGLVSQLCLAAATRRALNLYVPMDTMRDYLDADDAAALIRSYIAVCGDHQPSEPVVRNLASERAVPIGAVIRTVQQIAHRPIRVALGTHPTSGAQVRDLRVVSAFPDEFPRPPITSLPVGVKRVYEHTLATLRQVRGARVA